MKTFTVEQLKNAMIVLYNRNDDLSNKSYRIAFDLLEEKIGGEKIEPVPRFLRNVTRSPERGFFYGWNKLRYINQKGLHAKPKRFIIAPTVKQHITELRT